MMDYDAFIKSKNKTFKNVGFEPDIPYHNSLFDFQKALTTWAIRKGRSAIWAGCGLGKAQHVDDKILSPEGWRTIGNASIGDEIIGLDGKTHMVTGVFKQGVRPMYEVKFSDQSIVRCDHDHLWAVYSQNQLYRGLDYSVKKASSILSAGLAYSQGQKKNFIPIISPIDFGISTPLPLDPYTLGVIIGDGSIVEGTPTITTPDTEIISYLNLPKTCSTRRYPNKNKCQYFSIVGGKHDNSTNPVKEILVGLGLFGKKSEFKFVPKEYLFSTKENRLAIIQGLLDTDGYTSGSCIEFCSSSARLTENMIWLVRSLGGTATESTDEPAHYVKLGVRHQALNKHRTIIKLPNGVKPFRFSRKADAHRPIQRKHPRKTICSMVDIGCHEAVCISTDAKDSLYITNGFTVTHNTRMQLEWSKAIQKHTKKPVLILAPLAVSKQTQIEGKEIGIDISILGNNSIRITNYEKLNKINPQEFGGIVLDESSILKNFAGKFKNQIIESFMKTPYKLCCSATPSPNDYTEIGNHAEFLNICSRSEMLSTYFVHDSGSTQKWRLKGHAEKKFFKWLASWAVMLNKPSDLGYDNAGFDLPPINIIECVVGSNAQNGNLFVEYAKGLTERRRARRESLDPRCEMAYSLVMN